MEKDNLTWRTHAGVGLMVFSMLLAIIAACGVGVKFYNDGRILRECEKHTTEMTVTRKEVSGAIKYRKCNIYVSDGEVEYKIAVMPPSTFNSYEKGDIIECVVYEDSDGEIVQVKALEDL